MFPAARGGGSMPGLMRRKTAGRYHTYKCRGCRLHFRIFLLRTLPKDARYCQICQQDPEIREKVDRALIEREQKEAV